MNNKLKIDQFWSWFEEVFDDFEEKIDNSTLINALDSHVIELGDFTWEIGPGQMKKFQLVISPGGDIEKLLLTEYIVSFAPEIIDWEFHSTKPKKDNGYIFYYGVDENKIDANEWTYYLLKFNDEFFDIVIIAENIINFDKQDQQSIGEILLDNILGEKIRIISFEYIDINENVKDKYLSQVSSIKNLENHLKHLRNRNIDNIL